MLALHSCVEEEQEARTPAPKPCAAPSNEDDSDNDDVLATSGATRDFIDEGDRQTASQEHTELGAGLLGACCSVCLSTHPLASPCQQEAWAQGTTLPAQLVAVRICTPVQK